MDTVTKINWLPALALLSALCLGSGAVAVANGGDDGDSDELRADTGSATAVTDRSAMLSGEIKHKDSATSLRFEYGPTTSYGQSTSAAAIAADSPTHTIVTATIDGLTPATRYHYRLIAWDRDDTRKGSDEAFTTAPAAAPAPDAATSPNADPDPDPASDPGSGPNPDADESDADGPASATVAVPRSAAARAPVLGGSVVVAPLRGSIKVKRPGSADFVTLAAGDSVPVGTIVDTRRGTVKLTSALGAGRTQAGEFRGALFEVRQTRAGRGVTGLVLRGANFAGCTRASRRSARAAATRRRKPPRRQLFARDKGGRFQTHGLTSIATVRGTAWVTTDTCSGTRTRVTEGAVSVKDRRTGKSVLVRAGKSLVVPRAR